MEWVSACAVALLIMRRFLVRLLDRWLLPGADAPSTTLALMTELIRSEPLPTPDVLVAALAEAEALMNVSNGRERSEI